ncbi:MAG: DUF547 domain-containing protein [Cellulophaga sp.]|nr:DUF547 domain-containing protein [Cellulophaga sp.]
MKKILFLTVLVLHSVFGFSQTTTAFFDKADTFFKTYIQEGKVAYQEIKKNKKELVELTELMTTVTVSKENVAEYQSFWINAYNISVINGVVSNYPLKSPLDKAGFFDKIKYQVGDQNITLNDMEHKMLRAVFPKEARFHFVLVCAGLGCPPIINQAYLPSTLEHQLAEQTKKALNDPQFIKVNKNKVQISQLFEWYMTDFTQDGKSITAYINQYKTEKLPENAKISFYAYDWTLNETKK